MKHASKNHYSAYEQDYLNWYKGRSGQAFDPTPLVHAARDQWGHRPELILALAECTVQWPEGTEGLYTYFIDTKAIKPGARWPYAGGLELKCEVYGELAVDIVHHPADKSRLAIHGIEFLDKVMGRDRSKGRNMAIAGKGEQKGPRTKAAMRVVHVK